MYNEKKFSLMADGFRILFFVADGFEKQLLNHLI